jgi:hypothetical protein
MSAVQTVDEFCCDNGLSKPMFYKLRRQGKAPRINVRGKDKDQCRAGLRVAYPYAANRAGRATPRSDRNPWPAAEAEGTGFWSGNSLR